MKCGLVWIGEEQRYFNEIRTVGKRKPRLQVKIFKVSKRVWQDVSESDIVRKPEQDNAPERPRIVRKPQRCETGLIFRRGKHGNTHYRKSAH